MSPADRDALVERGAFALYGSKHADMPASILARMWGYTTEETQERFRRHFRAALAVAEPAVREDEREGGALVAKTCQCPPCGTPDTIASLIRARREPT